MIIGTAFIVLSWVLLIKLIPLWACIVITVFASFVILFCMLFGIYFFNLDMKLTSKLEPILIKLNEKRKRKQREI